MPAILNEDGSLDVTCNKCGKPIVSACELGMFCEDRCGYKESVRGKRLVDGLLNGLMALCGESDEEEQGI